MHAKGKLEKKKINEQSETLNLQKNSSDLSRDENIAIMTIDKPFNMTHLKRGSVISDTSKMRVDLTLNTSNNLEVGESLGKKLNLKD